MKRKHLLYALIPVFALALLAGGVTHASTENTAKPNPLGKLAEAIATKFNLNVSDVQAVIDENMPPRQEQQAPKEDPIKKAVVDGKLTQAQYDLIMAKRAEIKASFDGFKSLSKTEREAAVKALKESIKQWAKDNSIPVKYVELPGGPMRWHKGPQPINPADQTSGVDAAATTNTQTSTGTETVSQ